jgi:hypothetical protein
MFLGYIYDNVKSPRKTPLKSSMTFSFSGIDKKIICTPLEAINHRIREVITTTYEPVELDPKCRLTTDVEIVEVPVGSKMFKVRRVFLCSNPYQVSWVVDSDLSQCMICELPFSWTKFRHHCR